MIQEALLAELQAALGNTNPSCIRKKTGDRLTEKQMNRQRDKDRITV